MTGQEYLKNKNKSLILTLASLVIILTVTSIFVRFDFSTFVRIPSAVYKMKEVYFPPEFLDADILLKATLDTMFAAVTATVVSSILAYISAILAMRTSKRNFMKYFIKFIAAVSRNVPNLIWALILVYALYFWTGSLVAFLALFLASYGLLVRTFSDVIGQVGAESVEALSSTGASYTKIVVRAIVPETLPAIVSWGLYALELNIRNSAIIGMVSGAGLGFWIENDKHEFFTNRMFGTVLIVTLLVLATDILVTNIRARLQS